MSLSLVANTGNFVRNIGEGSKAFKTFAGTATGLGTALGATSETFKRFDQKVKQTGQAMLVTSAGMAASMAAATHQAADFQQGMLDVSSITKETGGELKSTGDQIMDLSSQFAQGSDEMATGLYDLASSGLEGAGAMNVLEVASKAATAGMTDTATASRAITAVLNAYQLSASEATDISDILFKTVEVGVLRFEDLAIQLGDFVPLGQAAGVTMGEMGAAIAALTRGGFPAAQAATSLAGAMRAFIKPSESMTAIVSELGYESSSAMLKTEGLEGALKLLHSTTGGNIESMGQLFQDTEGLRGVLTLTANDGALLSEALDSIADKSNRAGATQDAFATQSQGLNNQLDILQNNIENASIQVGEHYLPAVTKVVETGSGMVSVFNDLPEPIHKATAYTGLFATGLMALGGFILATQLRMKLYAAVFTGFSNQMGSGKLGTAFKTAANNGGGLVRTLGTMAANADFTNTRFSRLGPTITKTGNMIANMSMRTVGAVGAAALVMLDFAASTKSAQREAEGWAEALMSETIDTSTVSTWTSSINQAKAEYNDFKENVFDSYSTIDRFGQAVAKVMPFMASSFEINSKKSDELYAAVTRAEYGLKKFNETMSTTVYEAIQLGQGDTGDLLADMFDIRSAERAMVMAGDAIRRWGDVTSAFEPGQAIKLFEDVDPAQVAAIAEQSRLISEMGEGEARNEAIAQLGEMRAVLADSTVEWIRNGGAAQDFEAQLETMRDPIMSMVDGAWELTEAQEALHDAMGEIGAADYDQTLQTQTDLLDTFREKSEKSRGSAIRFAESLLEAGYISQPFFDGMIENIKASDEKWDAFVEGTKLSLSDYAATLEGSTARLNIWKDNMLEVASRASEVFPQEVADLSGQVTDYLASMGEEGVDLTALMADGTDEEFQRMYLAIIGHLKATSDEGAVEMDAAMKIIEESGRLGGEATAAAIADELGLGVSAVQGIMDEYGDVIVGGVNEILVQMGRAKIQRNQGKAGSQRLPGAPPGFRAEDGGFLPGEATFEPATRGSRGLVQWAEAETEGEWFIPAAKSKKNKSVKHLADAAAHFGFAMTPMADGGWFNGSDVPKPPDFGKGNIAYGGRVGAEELHEQTSIWVDQNGLGMARPSSSGIDPAFMRRWNVLSDRFGLSMVSGFRSYEQQAQLYKAYKAGKPGQAPAAPPGRSNHERGMAIDHSPHSTPGIRSAASDLKLWYPMGYEPWHVEPIETKSFDRGGFLDPGYTIAYNGTGQPEPVGSAAQLATVMVTLDPKGADRLIVELIRKIVRVQGGGNVQVALGQKQ